MESSEQTAQNLTNSIEEVVAPVPPEAPPQHFTRKQIGQLRRQWITTTHGTVRACGHLAKFSKDHDPKNNCIHCWTAYFMSKDKDGNPYVDLDLIHAVLTTKGGKALVAMRGTKFTKMFHGFLSSQLLPALAAEINSKPQDEAPATIVGGTFGTDQELVQTGVSGLPDSEGSLH